MRTQERRDEVTLQISAVIALVLGALAGAGLITLLVHGTVGLSGIAAERTFATAAVLIGLVLAVRSRRGPGRQCSDR